LNAITTHEPAMLGFLQRAVSDPGFDVNKFEVVLAAVREEQAKHAEREFYRSMSAAQGEMEPIRKDAINPQTRSKYARFEAVDGHLRPIYTRHGFSVSYRTGTPSRPGAVRMICTVAHEAGHSVEAELEAGLDGQGAQGKANKTDVQATGSTVSYLRRYILNMVFNVALATDDDDGEGSRAPRERSAPSAWPKRSEMDQTMHGDDIPDFDAQKPDRLLKVTERFDERMDAVQDQDGYNAIMANQGLLAEWAKIRTERPELDARMQAKATATLQRIAPEPSDAEAA
jgi:hypothetical protein